MEEQDHPQTGNAAFRLGSESGLGKSGYGGDLHGFGQNLHGPDDGLIIALFVGPLCSTWPKEVTL